MYTNIYLIGPFCITKAASINFARILTLAMRIFYIPSGASSVYIYALYVQTYNVYRYIIRVTQRKLHSNDEERAAGARIDEKGISGGASSFFFFMIFDARRELWEEMESAKRRLCEPLAHHKAGVFSRVMTRENLEVAHY